MISHWQILETTIKPRNNKQQVINKIDMPNMSAHYKEGIVCFCQQNDNYT